MTTVRLNKYLADQNICSRRQADNLIKNGMVIVNGDIELNPAYQVGSGDIISYTFDLQEYKKSFLYIKLNKPKGYVVGTNHEEGVPVRELIKDLGNIFPIGRLDKESSGLLILTNDGSLPKSIIGQESLCEKEYFVRVSGAIPDGALEKLRHGVILWGERTKPAQLRRVSENAFFITLVEGKNRQIRRICQKVGYPVRQLERVRIHTIGLGSLQPGAWNHLSPAEMKSLFSLKSPARSNINAKNFSQG